MGQKYQYMQPSTLPDDYDVTRQDVWHGLKENTTAHGIPHVTRARGSIKRGFWSVVVFCTIVALCYHTISISMLFAKYPVTVTITLLHSNELIFPAVTVCNMSPVRKSSLVNSSAVEEVVQQRRKRRRRRRKRSAGDDDYCESGWQIYNQNCYYVSVTTEEHSDAQTACQALGANLVSIADQAEQDFVVTITYAVDSAHYWMGFYKPGLTWAWKDGEPVGYINWATLEPDNSGPCGRLAENGVWRDKECDADYKYVCKKEASIATTVAPTTETTDITTTVPEVVTTTEPTTTVLEAETTTVVTTEPTTTVLEADTTTVVTTEPTTTVLEADTTTVVTTEPTTTVLEADTTTVVTTEPTTTVLEAETTTVVTTEPTTTVLEADTTTVVTTEPTTTVLEADTTTVVTTEPTTTVLEAETTTVVTTEPTTTVLEADTTTVVTTEPTTAVTPEETTEASTTVPVTSPGSTTVAETTSAETPSTQSQAEFSSLQTTEPPPTSTLYDSTTLAVEVTTTRVKRETPDTSLESSCCCTCCFQSDYYGGSSCSSCEDHTVSDAATCAASKYVDPIVIPTSASTVEEEPDPQPVEGSKFPERVETRENFKEEEKLTEVLADVNTTQKTSLGTSAEELILDCQYAGANCYLRDFATFNNPVHGNCYVFNSGWNSSMLLKRSHRAGRRHGLHLTVNIDQDEYVEEVGDTAGLRLVVHPQERMPFPEDEGITIETGRSTSIGIRQVLINRKPSPYGNCRKKSAIDYSNNIFQELYPVQYSTTSCTKTCYQQHVIEKCGCADAEVPMHGHAFNNVPVRACDSSDIDQDDCKYEVSGMYNRNELNCDCPSSCSDVDYQLEVSTGIWPSNVQKTDVLQSLAPKIGNILSDPSNPEKYKDNLIKLEIYYEEFNFEQITERPSYPPENYLSDIGGVLGLWLGMSILTIFEFFEFFLDLAVLTCASKCSRNQVQSMPPADKQKQAESLGGAAKPGEKNGSPHGGGADGNTETFVNTAPPARHVHTPLGNGRKQGSREELMDDSMELNNVSPPPPYTSRAGSGNSSTANSGASQRSQRSRGQSTAPSSLEGVDESYLLSV